MKNTLIVSTLVLAFGYPTAVAANMIGFVSSSVPSLPAFIGYYAAAGILAFAFSDYSHQPASRAS